MQPTNLFFKQLLGLVQYLSKYTYVLFAKFFVINV